MLGGSWAQGIPGVFSGEEEGCFMAKPTHLTESRVKVDQLRPGVFIQLDAAWISHPFFFN
jgi:hypothetical protein